uniref:Uncharacterized protein n=1 Tax=Ixodes ricinus TaxID=34613 RepID=A0A6B0UX38_IXORI
MRSLRCSCSRSLLSASSLSTVADSFWLWSSFIFSRCRALISSPAFSSSCCSSRLTVSSIDPCLSWAMIEAMSTSASFFENCANFCSASSRRSCRALIFSSLSFNCASLLESSCSNFSFRSWRETLSLCALRQRFSSVDIRSSWSSFWALFSLRSLANRAFSSFM